MAGRRGGGAAGRAGASSWGGARAGGFRRWPLVAEVSRLRGTACRKSGRAWVCGSRARCADLEPLSPAFGRLGRRERTVMQSSMHRTPFPRLPFGEKSASGTGGFREVEVTSGFTKVQEAGWGVTSEGWCKRGGCSFQSQTLTPLGLTRQSRRLGRSRGRRAAPVVAVTHPHERAGRRGPLGQDPGHSPVPAPAPAPGPCPERLPRARPR